MKRRLFLKNNATILASIPLITLSPNLIIGNLNPEVYKCKIGEFDCSIFKDLMFNYHAKDFFINADKVELEDALNKYKISPENIPSPFISMLLQRGDKKILIDSGIGFSEDPLTFRGKDYIFKGRVNQLLVEEGVNQDEITDVIISHFHLDHIGGIFSDKSKLNFPNAKFHMHEREWEFWHSSNSDEQSPLFKFFIEKNITPLRNQNLNLIRGDFKEIIPGIKAVNADGHTPGQIALIIGIENDQLIYIADAFLHPLHIERLNWQTNYDFDHKKAKQTRIKLLELANENEMKINAFHFDFPGLGRVEKINENWKWEYLEN